MQAGGPGWNDPPNLTYKTHTETGARRNVLNKRVSHLDQPPTTAKTSVTLDPLMPPPMIPTPINPPPQQLDPLSQSSAAEGVNKGNAEADNDFDWIGGLRELASESSSFEKVINQKIDVAIRMRDEGKLSRQVEKKMTELTRCVQRKQYDEAWTMHVSMMCDHIAEVRSWMPGVKKLISELKSL